MNVQVNTVRWNKTGTSSSSSKDSRQTDSSSHDYEANKETRTLTLGPGGKFNGYDMHKWSCQACYDTYDKCGAPAGEGIAK